jgi:cysteine peptidase C
MQYDDEDGDAATYDDGFDYDDGGDQAGDGPDSASFRQQFGQYNASQDFLTSSERRGQQAFNPRLFLGLPPASTPPASGAPVTGIDFIPPLTAKMRVIAPPKNMGNAEVVSARSLPRSFNWADMRDVAQKRFPGANLPLAWYVRPPPDQGACGSCWAVSSASMHGDRWRIFSQQDVPPLSSTYILSCADKQGNAQCGGGYAATAGALCVSKGIPPESCWPYTWCQRGACSSREIPDCASLSGGCLECGGQGCGPSQAEPLKLYKALDGHPSGVRSLSGKDAIKQEIFAHGPVVGSYFVFGDFMLASTPGGWGATGGIYMHCPELLPYQQSRIDAGQCANCVGRGLGAAQEVCPSAGQQILPALCYIGGHAVKMVGWGVQDGVPGFGTVEYWVVQNSWGSAWNEGGYFRYAMSGTYQYNGRSVAVNTEVGLDQAVTTFLGKTIESGQTFGGVTVWHPATMFNEPPSRGMKRPPPKPDNNNNNNNNNGDDDGGDGGGGQDDDNQDDEFECSCRRKRGGGGGGGGNKNNKNNNNGGKTSAYYTPTSAATMGALDADNIDADIYRLPSMDDAGSGGGYASTASDLDTLQSLVSAAQMLAARMRNAPAAQRMRACECPQASRGVAASPMPQTAPTPPTPPAAQAPPVAPPSAAPVYPASPFVPQQQQSAYDPRFMQMQAPQMQAPQMHVPQMQAPQMHVPQMQAPQMQAPPPYPFPPFGSASPQYFPQYPGYGGFGGGGGGGGGAYRPF